MYTISWTLTAQTESCKTSGRVTLMSLEIFWNAPQLTDLYSALMQLSTRIMKHLIDSIRNGT